MASLMAGLLGLAFFASLAVGTWLLVVALVGAGVLTLGSSRAIGSYWWPTALAGALVGVALSLMLITNLAPWASVSVLETPQAFVLAAGGFALLGLAVWSSTVMVQALRRLEALQEQP